MMHRVLLAFALLVATASASQLQLSYNPPLVNGTMNMRLNYEIVFSSPDLAFQTGHHFLISSSVPPSWYTPHPYASYPSMPIQSFWGWTGTETHWRFQAKAVKVENWQYVDLTETLSVEIPLVNV